MKDNDIQPCVAVMNIIRILFCGRLREKGPIDISHLWFCNILACHPHQSFVHGESALDELLHNACKLVVFPRNRIIYL